jgi:methyl-accepting chemotaxis protein
MRKPHTLAVSDSELEADSGLMRAAPQDEFIPLDLPLSLTGLIEPVPPLPASAPAEAARDRFTESAAAAIAVTGPDGAPLGVIERGRFMLQLSSRYGFALFAGRRAGEIMETDFLALPAATRSSEAYHAAAVRPAARRLDSLVILADGQYAGLVGVPALMEALAEYQRRNVAELELLRRRDAETTRAEAERRAGLEADIGLLLQRVQRYSGGDLSSRPHAVGSGPLAAVDRGVEEMRGRLADLLTSIQLAAHQTNAQTGYLRQAGEKIRTVSEEQLARVQDLMQAHEFLKSQVRASGERARLAVTTAQQSRVMVESGVARVGATLNRLALLGEATRKGGELAGEAAVNLEATGGQGRVIEDLLSRILNLSEPGAERPEDTLIEVHELALAASRRNQELRGRLQSTLQILAGMGSGFSRMHLLASQGGSESAAARAGLDEITEALGTALGDLAEIASRHENQDSLLATSESAVQAVLERAEENGHMALSLADIVARMAEETADLAVAARRISVS